MSETTNATAEDVLGRVHIAGFRSIKKLTLELEPVTLLVGQNGAGKSNLIDAILFVSEALEYGLRAAIKKRQGIDKVRRRPVHALGGGRRADIRVELQFYRGHRRSIAYGLTLGHKAGGGWHIKEEWASRRRELVFLRNEDEWQHPPRDLHSLSSDKLALPLLNDETSARLLELIGGFFRYDIQLEKLRQPQPFESDQELSTSADNLYHLWERLAHTEPEVTDRVTKLLGQILPGLTKLRVEKLGGYAIMEADFEFGEQGHHQVVDNSGLSDGTLRALALLMAAYQSTPRTLIAVEEPEVALHPRAAGLLFQAILSAPASPQILMSTHSPFILESGDVDVSSLRIVQWKQGETVAGKLATDQLEDIRDHLVTHGELLEEGSLRLDDSISTGRFKPSTSTQEG